MALQEPRAPLAVTGPEPSEEENEKKNPERKIDQSEKSMAVGTKLEASEAMEPLESEELSVPKERPALGAMVAVVRKADVCLGQRSRRGSLGPEYLPHQCPCLSSHRHAT